MWRKKKKTVKTEISALSLVKWDASKSSSCFLKRNNFLAHFKPASFYVKVDSLPPPTAFTIHPFIPLSTKLKYSLYVINYSLMMQSPRPRTKPEIIFTLSPSQCTDHEFGFAFFPSEIKSNSFNYQKELFLRHFHV